MGTAAQILTDSVNAAIAVGLTISLDSDMLGVVCTSSEAPLWEIDPMAKEISPLGAVLLATQPPLVDEDRALAHVFGSRPEFHEGIEDGACGRRNLARDDRLYTEGHLLGVQVRELIQRRYGIPVERSSIEITEEIDA